MIIKLKMKIFFALMPLTLAWAVNLGSDKKRPATPIDELPGKVPDQDFFPNGFVKDEFLDGSTKTIHRIRVLPVLLFA